MNSLRVGSSLSPYNELCLYEFLVWWDPVFFPHNELRLYELTLGWDSDCCCFKKALASIIILGWHPISLLHLSISRVLSIPQVIEQSLFLLQVIERREFFVVGGT